MPQREKKAAAKREKKKRQRQRKRAEAAAAQSDPVPEIEELVAPSRSNATAVPDIEEAPDLDSDSDLAQGFDTMIGQFKQEGDAERQRNQ